MTSIEFGKKCRPFNQKYYELFGEVPCPADYACSQDEFFEALNNAIKDSNQIEIYLKKKTVPDLLNGDIKI
jgi:hypothetical protein